MGAGDPYTSQSVPPPGWAQSPVPSGNDAPHTTADGTASGGAEGAIRATLSQPVTFSSLRGGRLPRIALGVFAVAAVAVAAVVLLTGSTPSKSQIAQAINLKQSDLPGWRSSPQSSSADQNGLMGTVAQTAQFKACAGPVAAALPDGNPPGEFDANSPYFTDGAGINQQQFSSQVSIETSPAVASQNFAQIASTLASPRALNCYGSMFERWVISTLNGAPVTISDVRVNEIPVPTTAAQRGFGLSISMQTHAAALDVPVTIDLYGYLLGRDETAIVGQGFGSIPTIQLARLAPALLSRAASQPH